MNIFAIIVTYNGRQVPYWYDNCFTSLCESTIPVQTIVIDNASTDDTVAYIREHFPEVILIELDKNLGFGQANNIGMRYALEHDADYVFLLNQDAWVEKDTLEKMVQIAEKNPEYGIFSPMHVRPNMKQLYIQIEDGSFDHGNQLLSDCYFNVLQDIYSMQYINAAAWLLPRSTLIEVGGFDPNFTHYAEDDNYLKRALYHGIKVGLCPKLQIVHDHQYIANPFVQKNQYIRKYQEILLLLLNPFKPIKVSRYLLFISKQMFKYCIHFNIDQLKYWMGAWKYISTHSSGIKFSQKEYLTKQPLWLE